MEVCESDPSFSAGASRSHRGPLARTGEGFRGTSMRSRWYPAPALGIRTMRIIASADIHGIHEVYDWLVDKVTVESPDAVVLAGDLFGWGGDGSTVEEGQAADRFQVLRTMSEIQCPIFYVMGNDDWIELDAPGPLHQSVHRRRVDFGDFNVVGYQYSLPFMGGVFEKPENEIEEDLTQLEAEVDSRTLFVTHGPAHGTLDRIFSGEHVGSESLREFLKRTTPRAHVHGHIHREFGRSGRHFNVASAGRKRAMLIDLKTMTNEIIV